MLWRSIRSARLKPRRKLHDILWPTLTTMRTHSLADPKFLIVLSPKHQIYSSSLSEQEAILFIAVCVSVTH